MLFHFCYSVSLNLPVDLEELYALNRPLENDLVTKQCREKIAMWKDQKDSKSPELYQYEGS